MTTPVRTLAARLDGLAMLALAGFMGWLVLGGNYWMYLNPKFKPVTLAAAIVLTVLGAYAAVRPVTRPTLGRSLCYLVLLIMAGITEGGFQSLSATVDSDPFNVPASLPAPEKTPTPVRLSQAGKDYIPINTGELFDVAAKGPGPAWDRRFAVRGFVHRDADLDAAGELVLYRLAVWCCFADGTAVGIRVKLPQDAPPPADKAWVVAYGALAEIPEAGRRDVILPGMSFSSVVPAALLAADAVETKELVPEEAYMFEWRQEEPYAF
ncbi:TIGR03943 family putative permease subunit [Solidesulfovibrio sp.]